MCYSVGGRDLNRIVKRERKDGINMENAVVILVFLLINYLIILNLSKTQLVKLLFQPGVIHITQKTSII